MPTASRKGKRQPNPRTEQMLHGARCRLA